VKITKRQLKRIIKEEKSKLLNEQEDRVSPDFVFELQEVYDRLEAMHSNLPSGGSGLQFETATKAADALANAMEQLDIAIEEASGLETY